MLKRYGSTNTQGWRQHKKHKTQGFLHKEGLPQDPHKNHLKRGAKTISTRDTSRERGLHHKHKSFLKNTRQNPRRAPLPQARTLEEISTKIINQEQNQ